VTKTTLHRWSVTLLLSLCSFLLSAAPQSVQAQSTGATITGAVTDVRGDALQSATVSVKMSRRAMFRAPRLMGKATFLSGA
jgi:hypothetical protein